MNSFLNPKTILIMSITVLLISFFFFDLSDSLLGQIMESFTSPNWDEVQNRNIIKNSIPIIFLEEATSGKCKVSADNFDLIVSHSYFVKANQLVDELEYDPDEKTLFVLCDQLVGEKSTLNVWYATEEAKKHSTKYAYFITEWIEGIK